MALHGGQLVIFVCCVCLVQVFMAFNGGATQGTVDVIEVSGAWTEAKIGLLGAMDKIGMTLSSTFWGVMLAKYPAKRLLVGGLALNAASTFLFGTLKNHDGMLLAKLVMGFTEGLQWVWSQLWVVKYTAGNPLYLNLSTGSAAFGNLLGTGIAGCSTAHGAPYGFAFNFEGLCLAGLWFVLMGSAGASLSLRDASPRTTSGVLRKMSQELMEGASAYQQFGNLYYRLGSMPMGDILWQPSSEDSGILRKLKTLAGNRLYCYTALGFAIAMYINSALSFLWIRIFQRIWSQSKDLATVALVLVSTGGGLVGVVIGSCVSTGTAEERLAALQRLLPVLGISTVGAFVAGTSMYLQAVLLTSGEEFISPTASLSLTYGGLVLVFIGMAAVQGPLVSICTTVVEDEDLRSFAVGIQQGLANLIGFTLGPLLPQVAMGSAAARLSAPNGSPLVLIVGVFCTMFATVLVFAACLFAWREQGAILSSPKQQQSLKKPLLQLLV